jgi:hypothetical protein
MYRDCLIAKGFMKWSSTSVIVRRHKLGGPGAMELIYRMFISLAVTFLSDENRR